MLRDLVVRAPHQGHHLLEPRTHVGGFEGAPLDVLEHEDAGFGMDHRRGDAGRLRRPAGRQLVEAHHAVDGNVLAHPDDEPVVPVADQEIGVGDAAAEGLGLDRPAPDRKGGDTTAGIVGNAHDARPRRCLMWVVPAPIRRSAIMAMAATQRPATRP